MFVPRKPVTFKADWIKYPDVVEDFTMCLLIISKYTLNWALNSFIISVSSCTSGSSISRRFPKTNRPAVSLWRSVGYKQCPATLLPKLFHARFLISTFAVLVVADVVEISYMMRTTGSSELHDVMYQQIEILCTVWLETLVFETRVAIKCFLVVLLVTTAKRFFAGSLLKTQCKTGRRVWSNNKGIHTLRILRHAVNPGCLYYSTW
jgi:hypothetical protein